MDRRKVLKDIFLGVGATAVLPSWAYAWTPDSLPALSNVSQPDMALLNQLVETMIPRTDTPGAGEMGIEKFVMAMIQDCTPAQQKETFILQLQNVNGFSEQAYSKPYAGLNSAEKTDLLQKISKSDDASWKTFFGLLKRYTIQGYQTSEYVMNKNGFLFAPGFYHGCVALEA